MSVSIGSVGRFSRNAPVRSAWVFSSAGRASPLQGECRRFDPVNTHQVPPTKYPPRFCIHHIVMVTGRNPRPLTDVLRHAVPDPVIRFDHDGLPEVSLGVEITRRAYSWRRHRPRRPLVLGYVHKSGILAGSQWIAALRRKTALTASGTHYRRPPLKACGGRGSGRNACPGLRSRDGSAGLPSFRNPESRRLGSVPLTGCEHTAPAGSGRSGRIHARSNSAIDSTCEVWGNIVAMPAPRSA